MPQSKEFWTWARQMREHEQQTPEDERVYLCILYLENGQPEDVQLVETVAEKLETELNDNQFKRHSSFSSELDDAPVAESAEHDPRRYPSLANTPSNLLRKGINFTMPQIVKKWHEIGTVNRHWALEVNGQIYELYRTNRISKFRKREVSQVPRIHKRLTARLYVGRTHMVDKVLVEIGIGLMNLQRHYEVQMDNCQHFVAVMLPRILCVQHCHMTTLPSASLPYVKYSEFGLLQAGVKEGNVSTIYHRFLHETKNLVWQHSKYYFLVNEDYVSDCSTITTNPYKAASRLIRGNFEGRHVERCPRREKDRNRGKEQRSVSWRDYSRNGKVRVLGELEEIRMFRNTIWPPEQRTLGLWVMHHINDWTEALGWTPQMFNEWLLANERETGLLIPLPKAYFRPQTTKLSLSRPASHASSTSGTSTTQSTYVQSDICLELKEGSCSCMTCQDFEMAQVIAESEEEFQRVDRYWQEAEDKILAQAMYDFDDSAQRTDRHLQELEDSSLAQILSAKERRKKDEIRQREIEQIEHDLKLARYYAGSRRSSTSSTSQTTATILNVADIPDVERPESAVQQQIREDEELALALSEQVA